MPRRIYIASSWRNATGVRVLAPALRAAGHEVYAFCEERAGHYAMSPNALAEIDPSRRMTSREALATAHAQQAFAADKGGLDWADTCVLLLPSGRSSHLEAGYTVGQGKDLFILDYEQAPGQWDVMYLFARAVCEEFDALRAALDCPLMVAGCQGLAAPTEAAGL